MRRSWIAVVWLMACSAGTNSELFLPGTDQGTIDKKLEEASGLVASATHPGYFWTHNDSGHGADLFLIDSQAKIAARISLGNVRNRDWEDITLGPGPEPNKSYLYVGDIGDNNARYPFKMIYRLEEPTEIEDVRIHQVDTLFLQLPDGPRDSEALMIDPVLSDMFLFSKREDSIRLYQFSNTWKSGDTLTANLKIKIPYFNTVAADISADGTEILLKTYNHVFYWKRAAGESVPETFKSNPVQLNYKPEEQGESIAWSRDGSGYYTLSESNAHKRAELLFYKRN